MIRRNIRAGAVLTAIALTGWLSGIVSCGSPAPEEKVNRNPAHAGISDAQIARGEALAAKFCQSCHLLPAPDLLPAAVWENGVLPQMGPRLGIFEYNYKKYPNNSSDPNVGAGFYPSAPLMSAEDWGALMDYYTALAPDSLPPQKRNTALQADSGMFRVTAPAVRNAATPPATCFIQYDTLLHQIWTADILRHTLDRWDRQLTEKQAILTGGAIVSMVREEDRYQACNIGTLAPTNAKAGYIEQLTIRGNTVQKDTGSLMEELPRPVCIASADLNGDGRKDLVVCGFGFLKGELAWLENKGNNKYEKHVLRSVPGAIRVVVQDYNHDGLPDIWVLFAQGDEGIWLYTNRGGGQFEERSLLRFPPSYGSTYFELVDWNQDGHPDILYTCGDNGDFSTVLKPYHGIYIYQNDGAEHFQQRYFYPVNGCYKAMAADLNGDGKQDIAAIAYFADFQRQPQEGFIYLQNEGTGGAFQFSAHSVPGTEAGRWMTMDLRDINGDGRPDILLGNCSVGPSFIHSATDWKKGPPFLVLTNRSK